MDNQEVEATIKERGLVECFDTKTQKKIYRRPGFNGVESFQSIEQKLGDFIRENRVEKELTYLHIADLIGLSHAVYGRYERADSSMNVSRMVHLWELLGFSIIDLIFAIAPQMIGDTPEKAQRMKALYSTVEKFKSFLSNATPDQVEEFQNTIDAMSKLPPEALRTMNLFFKQMAPHDPQHDMSSSLQAKRKKAESDVG